MRLYHATLKSNLDSINRLGISAGFSRGKEAVVWLHTKSRREWAVMHTMKRHNVTISEVVILAVDVPRQQLRRRWRGLWTTPETLTDFQSITDAATLAASPFEEV